MTFCSYGRYRGVVRARRCSRKAFFVCEVADGRLRQFCPHHAAMMQGLGWRVYNVMKPGEMPAYAKERRTA